MHQFEWRFLASRYQIRATLLVGTRREWKALPESRSPYWRATTLGRRVLALGVDLYDPRPDDPAVTTPKDWAATPSRN